MEGKINQGSISTPFPFPSHGQGDGESPANIAWPESERLIF